MFSRTHVVFVLLALSGCSFDTSSPELEPQDEQSYGAPDELNPAQEGESPVSAAAEPEESAFALEATGLPEVALLSAPTRVNTVRAGSDETPVSRTQPFEPGAQVEIAGGNLALGTTPGLPGRRVTQEADLHQIELGAFSIDALPYPNDPARAARVGVTRDEAERLCSAEGKRLCTEFEWERACKGDAGDEYPTGNEIDLQSCRAEDTHCATSVGVGDMGIRAAEWTSSSLGEGAVIRGSGGEDLATHRCGARRGVGIATTSETLGFRCCSGEANALAYPSEPERRPYRKQEPSLEVLRAALRSIPSLARHADTFEPTSPMGIHRAIARGGKTAEDLHGWETSEEILVWTPQRGETVWVFSGLSEHGALVVVLHPLEGGGFVHGASFVTEGERQPIAIYFANGQSEVRWTPCLGCAGEGGIIRVSEEGRLVIVQQ